MQPGGDAVAQSHRDFYTVPEAADALGVSVSTIRRWIADRRLPAFRLGPKALRIRRQDVDAAGEAAVSTVAARPPMSPIYKSLSEIPPLTAEDRARRWAAVEAMDAFRKELSAGRGGKLFSDSAALIRAEREKRSRHLEKISMGSAKYRAAKRKAEGSANR